MALKSREAIASAVCLFIAWALAAHWAPSLRLGPLFFLAGAILVAAGVLYIILTTSRPLKRVAPRTFPPATSLGFTTPAAWASEVAASKRRARYTPQTILALSPQLSDSLDSLLELIQRDFLRSWYGKISSGGIFTNEVDRTIRITLRGLANQLAEADLVKIFVVHIVPILDAHLKNATEASRLVRGRNVTGGMTEGEELDIAVAARYCDGNVHAAASLAASKTKGPQQKHLRDLVEAIVAQLLPDNMTTSRSVTVLVREIVACAIMLPIMQLISDPDTMNQLVEAYGRSVLHDRKTVRKLRAALDEHASPKSKKQTASSLRLAPNDNERSFEKFIRTISQCTNLTDARRYGGELSRLIARERASSTPAPTYLRRLELGKKLLDQKVAQLSRQPMARSASASKISETARNQSPAREHATLRQVLYDATGLSYFMEYMDRHKLMSWVQFWIIVDGMRGPLDQEIDPTSASARPWTEADWQDLKRISEAYLKRPEMKVAQDTSQAVSTFLAAGPAASTVQFAEAQNALFNTQQLVLQEMERHHFPQFQASDLFHRWIASAKDQPSTPSSEHPPRLPQDKDKSGGSHGVKAPAISRLQSDSKVNTLHNESGLRRAANSSSSLFADAAKADTTATSRRSFDEARTRAPLFDDEVEPEPMKDSIQSLDSTGGQATPGESAVDAVQAALNELVEGPQENEALFSDRQALFQEADSGRVSLDIQQHAEAAASDKEKPSLSSLGLLGTPSRRTVFSEGDLFGESEQMWEEDGVSTTVGDDKDEDEDNIREAAPGDLGLAELVQSLTVEIDKLEAQQGIVDSLTRKAELTNNAAELRILRKSKTSLGREIRRKELQRQQYIIQESDNTLYGKATISIKNVMVGTEPDGHEFALYVIEVQRKGSEKAAGASWAITRRYSEFYELFKRLRRRFPELRDLDFPRRQVVLTLQKDFLRKRRVALERFLGELLTSPAVCKSIEFRAFLSQQTILVPQTGDGPDIDRQDFVSRIYNSVTDGMEEFLGNVPVLDQLSVAGQNLISAASSAAGGAGPSRRGQDGNAVFKNELQGPESMAEAQAELKAFETSGAATLAQQQATRFITPLADAFIEVFQLHTGNAWLRGRAVVVILQQLLGGTVERKVREAYRNATLEQALVGYVELAKDTLWPGGRLRTAPPARSDAEKARSRKEATAVLATLLPDLAGGVVGRSNASAAGKRIAATLNNERLNAHLAYTMLDKMAEQVFGVTVGR